MTRRTPSAVRAAVTGAVLAAATAGCTAVSGGGQAGQPATARPAASCPAAGPGPALPVTAAALAAVVSTAGRFTAAYYTWPAATSPRAWLARLRPLATHQLAARLAQAAAARTGSGESSNAVVTGRAIRLVAAGMVIVTVQARQDQAGATASVSLAVTLVPAGSGWAVYDAEPASAGDSGGPDAAP